MQEKELPLVVGAAYEVLSANEVMKAESNRHSKLDKYVNSINHSISRHNRKLIYFNNHIWGI